MGRHRAVAAAAVALAVAPQAADAASGQLTVRTQKGRVVAAGTAHGVPVFKTFYRWPTELDAHVLDDAGAPASGVEVALVQVTPDGQQKELQKGVTQADGSRRFVISQPAASALFLARVTADPAHGTSAVDTNQVLLGVAPRIRDDSPLVIFGTTYPIRGHIEIPHASRAGVFVLQKKVGMRFRTLARRAPTAGGRFAFRVNVTGVRVWNRFKVTFLPRGDGQELYLASELSLRVRRR